MKKIFAFFIVLAAAGSALVRASEAPEGVEKKIDFVRDIQPIFKSSCYSCHGPEKQKGHLRMDSKPLAMQGGVTGKMIVSGKSKESLLISRVLGLGDEERMPLKADALTPDKIATLKNWIDQGAPWPDSASVDAKLTKHWSYVKPVRLEPAPVKNTAWCRNPIDKFVLARLEKENLQPAPEAAKETLIRRLSLDLTGLPPSIAEVDAFVVDTAPDAYEKCVDRLLASPHFGERQARPWLDLARFADTNGYEKDNRRQIWKYRDWVINAFNRDMPFDQFTIEQIAGDMLPGATVDQKVATGFHRNTMYNDEGGVDREEARWETLVDRVNTTATVWLGATMACAQCHNHKYDPISQKDYYQMLAFFNNADEPTLKVPTTENEAKRKVAEAQVAKLQEQLKAASPQLEEEQRVWEKEATQTIEWAVLEPLEMSAANGTTLKHEQGTVLASGTRPEKDVYTIKTKSDLSAITAFRLEVLPEKSLPASGPGRSDNGNFVLTNFAVRSSDKAIKLSRATADHAQGDFPAAHAIDAKPETGWAIAPEFGKPHQTLFEAVAPVDGKALTFVLEQNSPHAFHTIGSFRLSATTAKAPALKGSVLPENIRQILAVTGEKRTEKQRADLTAYFRTIAPSLKSISLQIEQIKKSVDNDLTTTLVMQEKGAGSKPAAVIRIRGNFLNKGEDVSASVPAVLHPLPPNAPPNRLGLAQWLVDAENPLVGRVMINRFWEQYFGRGLVETSEDFGLQGDRPTHPELLDWLATEFMQQRWSMKAIHKLIVMSAAYRQSSKLSPQLLERDPYNKLYARGPRFRLEAELIRDLSLAVSGQLSRKVGGPSVFPPQPEGIWNIPYSGDKWRLSDGDERFRRGLYTFWRRTSPYPSFMSFDAPSREFCSVRRTRTNTPLQALTTLNDPAFFESARATAARIYKDGGPDAPSRISYAFRLCLARKPLPRELDALMSLFNRELLRFSADAAAAKELLKGSTVPEAQLSELAALIMVSNILLNLDETLTRE